MSNLLSWASSGYKDWVWVRISAIVFLVYSLAVRYYWTLYPQALLNDWRVFILNPYMKVLGTIALVSFVIHSWIGLWTVITDYLKPVVLYRLAIILVLALLFANFVFGIVVLWG
ncbi:MAG: succinate dehydrogenase, hydrophobic membrane anchor protein [Pseudomonadota bacterium]|nr:succinate dehydrogenase, hydrophobic membrane anchor protein [Pseudomonadota bacterium]